MTNTKLKTAIAGTALIAFAATATMATAQGSPLSPGQPRLEQNQPQPPGAIEADGPNVFPHSADFDIQSKTFYAGSLKSGAVSTVGPDGKVSPFIQDPAIVSAQAVNVDRERNRVLVSNTDYGLADRSNKEDPFRIAGVGSYDLATGRQHWCVDLAAILQDGRKHLISDVTVAPDGTAYAVDELTPTIFRIDQQGSASVFLQNDLLRGKLDIPDFLDGVGMAAVEWVDGDQLIIAMAEGSLIRVPVQHPEQAQPVQLSAPLVSPTAGMRLLPDGSISAVSSGLLSGEPAQIQRVQPSDGWQNATVKVTDTVADPVTSDVTEGPGGTTYALSGGLAAFLGGKPNDGFTLTPVETD
ncbi:hypothetical protein ACFWPH_07310 [Nocardia sp. NPDC058499]|uniref:hypothetical protein n=1 Tax=Nocardia sp. NPDC058499 TaxID=3346530 RepID=UPI0036610A5D